MGSRIKKKIVVGVSGASGSIYFQRTVEMLKKQTDNFEEIAIVMSQNATTVFQHEIGTLMEFKKPFKLYDRKDYFAPFASGSSSFELMIIVPCSMGTLSKIANGTSNCLLSRAADVFLKERKKLICVLRETPYNLIHIENMKQVTLAGGLILPASPSFYHLPKTIDEVTDTVVHRVLSVAGINTNMKRWQE